MKKRSLPWFAVLVFGTAPSTILASSIMGTTQGSSVGPKFGIDDYNVSTTMNATYVASDPAVLTALALAGFDASQYVFAGQGDAVNISSVPASDFNITQYFPWVVNDNASNSVPFPSGINANRGITGQDAGGAVFLMTYTPTLNTDPHDVNFIQIIKQDDNRDGFHAAHLDNFDSTTSPYYNQGGHQAGVVGGMTGMPNLVIPNGGSAWLGDIPYACENGTAAQRHDGANCSGGADETILSQTRIFETLIETDMTLNGKSEKVIVGGVMWGYTYTNFDAPEPSSALLFGVGLIALAGARALRPFLRSQSRGGV
jgi:hypothetical protein